MGTCQAGLTRVPQTPLITPLITPRITQRITPQCRGVAPVSIPSVVPAPRPVPGYSTASSSPPALSIALSFTTALFLCFSHKGEVHTLSLTVLPPPFSSHWCVFYILFMCIGAFFAMQLFVGVLYERFVDMQNKMKGKGGLSG